jgi:DNA-binding transcriptional LysR family regulator
MKEEIELRHLRYFLAVADTLHFTRAARQLGIAQPPLSQQIKRLEQLLGHPLFERTTRGVKLTPAGRLLADRARATLSRVAEDIELARRTGRGEEGALTVGFSGSIMFTELPAAIKTFRRRYPRVELRLREMVTADQLISLQDGTLNLAFMRDGDPTPGIDSTPILKERYVAVLPETHPLAARPTLRVADLSAEPFILFHRHMGPLAFDRTVACCQRAGFTPNIVQNAPQFPTLFRLIAAGIGVTLAPACMLKLTIPGAVYREVHNSARTTVDLGIRAGYASTLAANFLTISKRYLTH